jgi:protein O-mannosyl-transferase
MPGKRGKINQGANGLPGRGAIQGTRGTLASLPRWLPIASVLLITALVYSRALFNGLTDFDDNEFILNNPLIRDTSLDGVISLFTSVFSGKYQPFVNLSFLLEHKFFGFNPVVYHLTNVLLHLASTWVVYRLGQKLSGQQITAIVVAALFALHPMHVEDVAWASERKDVLYALFYLLSLLFYMKYTESDFGLKNYLLMLLFFVISLFSKTSAMTLPLILIAIDIYKGRPLTKRAWLEKFPVITFAVIFQSVVLFSHQVGGMSYHLPEGLNIVKRFFLMTTVPAFYIVKLFLPTGLSAMHYYPDKIAAGVLPWMYYVSFPFLIVVTWLAVRQSVFRKDMIFGISFFLITIIVMEQIIAVGPALTPERYTYIPYIGLFYIIGQLLSNVQAPKIRKAFFSLFAVVLIIFSVQTWARIAVWKDSDSIFSDIINHNEGNRECYDIYGRRGNLRLNEGNYRDAVLDYNQSILFNRYNAEAHNNRATALFQLGALKPALADFNAAIQIDPGKHKPYDNRASLKASLGDFVGALVDYNYYLTMEPGDARAYTDRGMVHLSLSDTSGACKDWNKATMLGDENAPQLLRQYCH